MKDSGLWIMTTACSLIQNASMKPVAMSYFCHGKQTHVFFFHLTLVIGPTKHISLGIGNTTVSNWRKISKRVKPTYVYD